MRRIERLLSKRPLDHDPGKSQPESNIALWLRAAGLGTPTMNAYIEIDGIRWEIDVSYLDDLVAVDYNSREFHEGPMLETQAKDARKRAAFEAAGWAFFQYGPDADEATVVEEVGRELQRRRRGS